MDDLNEVLTTVTTTGNCIGGKQQEFVTSWISTICLQVKEINVSFE